MAEKNPVWAATKRHYTSAKRDLGLILQDALADIGNTYRAVHMQHTGWITSGRYHHMDTSHAIAQEEAKKEPEQEPEKEPEAPWPKGPEIRM